MGRRMDRGRAPASRVADRRSGTMRAFLRRVPLAREAYREPRRALGIPASNDYEMLLTLRAEEQRRPKSGPGIQQFAWGSLEYTHRSIMIAQFEQIFVTRQYAFTPDRPNPVIVDCGGNIGMSA